MFMNVEIELSGTTTTVLPDDAIVRFENKNYVFAAKSNRQFVMLEVQIGNSENGFTEILNAEKFTNQNFVTKGAYTLLMTLKNISDE